MWKFPKKSAKAPEASYAVSLLVAKAKKPFYFQALLYCKKRSRKIQNCAFVKWHCLPRNWYDGNRHCWSSCRKLGEAFSLPVDESTDVSGEAQLIALVRYSDTDDTCEHILYWKSLERKRVVERTFLMLLMSCLKAVWAGNPAAVCVLTELRQWQATWKGSWHVLEMETLKCVWTHCVIHREALASKKQHQTNKLHWVKAT